MNKLFLFLLLFFLIIAESFAESITITSPESGSTIYIPVGQSTTDVQVCWDYTTDSSEVWFSLRHGDELTPNINSCYTVHNEAAGSKNWTLHMNYLSGASTTITFEFDVVLTGANITADNNFVSGTSNLPPGGTNPTGTHGLIKVDGNVYTAPYSFSRELGDQVILEAVSPQTDENNYKVVWHTGSVYKSDWTRNNAHMSYDKIHSFSVTDEDNGKTYMANLRKVYKITFQNSFVNAGNGGVIMVSSSQHESPSSGNEVVELNQITASAIDQIINGIFYGFDHWNDGSTNGYKTFSPSSNETYTAYFKGYASPIAINFGWDYHEGHPIKFHWTDNPNTGVTQYQIWRKVKYDGVMQEPVLLATVGRNVETYTDYEYSFMHNPSANPLWYDVRQYYSVEHTYSEEYWHPTNGQPLPKSNGQIAYNSTEIKEYALGCYPNPFNPSTKISYQIPKEGVVTIKIYDILGREIKTMINEYREVGRYEIDFDASDLPSGVYLYRLKSNDYVSVKKMLLTK
jgi:hypothetical protein